MWAVDLAAIITKILSGALASACLGIAMALTRACVGTQTLLTISTAKAFPTETTPILALAVTRAAIATALRVLAIRALIGIVAHTDSAVTEAVTIAIVRAAKDVTRQTRVAFDARTAALLLVANAIVGTVIDAHGLVATDTREATVALTRSAQAHTMTGAISRAALFESGLVDPFGIVLREFGIRFVDRCWC